jgi:hypothetical protein
MSDMNQPGSGVNYDEICNVLEQKMQPVFDLIAQRFAEHEEVIGKIVGGMHDAVGSYKRGAMQKTLGEKYGEELGPLDEYSNTNFGKSFSDDLLDALQGDEAPGDDERDGFIRGKIDGFKGRFGKYLGQPPKVEATVIEAKTPEEAPAAPESPAEPEAKEPEKKSGPMFAGHNGGIIPDMVDALAGRKGRK